MKIAVIGYGVVGRHMARDIEGAGNEVVIYDKYQEHYKASSTKEVINAECAAAFVCVGTPEGADGKPDMSAIEEVFAWLNVPVAILRSTVPPGTTQALESKMVDGRHVVFVPEFIGEGVNAPYNNMRQPPFLIIGGTIAAQEAATQVLCHIYNAECEFVFAASIEAEIAKYAENYFLALKVTWANELYDICEELGASYPSMMSALIHDYRIGRSHTHVFADRRGFDGRCLPKDTAGLLAVAGVERAPLLDAMRKINAGRRKV
jgi:UDPglucose 6-dehydrogenase